MKIYTRKGDCGTTSLAGGARVCKDDARVEAYGTVDELMAHIAYMMDMYGRDEREELLRILCCLMTAASLLASDGSHLKKLPGIEPQEIDFLEECIDRMNEALPAIDKFTLPGGHPAVSMAHICRTVCRRAERATVAASCKFDINPQVMAYLNRLSDYLYTLGRYFSVKYNAEELLWLLDK